MDCFAVRPGARRVETVHEETMDVLETIKGKISEGKIPTHVAVIMDGNGRWAKRRGLPRIAGHRAGIKSVRQVVEGCREISVQAVTLYAISTENYLRRPKREVSELLRLLRRYLRQELDTLNENDIRLHAIGRTEELPKWVQAELDRVERLTASNDAMVLNLALNYGGRGEILDAIQRVVTEVKADRLDPRDLDEARFSQFLYTADLPDPDLVIRTGGESRISNFLLWQVSYAEFLVTPTLWPDFGKEELFQAVIDYQQRERRYGGVKSDRKI